MMIYAISDLHGEYDKYLAMLRKINFSDSDQLYVLGDVVDRGKKPVEILQDMRRRPNVIPIMGNHDKMAIDVLTWLLQEITEQSIHQSVNQESMYQYMVWQMNGSQTTIDGFYRLSREERNALLGYMRKFAPYKVVETGGRRFILVHAGLGDFSREKKLDEYSLRELAFIRFDYDKEYFGGNTFIVTGHTPTLAITGEPEIYYSRNNICIDCGAVFASGALACLCLDNMWEYYVD